MLFADILRETYLALSANKARTGLTVLGIVIGIGSVIAMIAIGTGSQASVEERIQSIGSNLLMVRPGMQRSPGQSVSQGQGSAESLTLEDANAIDSSVISVEYIAPVISGSYQVVANGENTRTSISGTTPEYVSVRSVALESGTFFTTEQNTRKAKVAVLGSDVKDALFEGYDDVIGQKVRINGIDFTVLGTTASKGGSGMGSEDDSIYIPLSTAIQYLSGSDSLSIINITIGNQDEMDAASEEITALLRKRHDISTDDEADFRVMNQADIVETATSVASTFTLLLGAVAGISLVVGGIGIMNMMLTTVTERTREIGLRKAIGAKRRDISRQFLVEAAALTLLGGVLGVAFGWLTAFGFSKFGGINTEVSTYSVVLAFSVSAVIGIVFGWYPARRAARLNPIEALRYE
jgi:putative ABC transport system permease protein